VGNGSRLTDFNGTPITLEDIEKAAIKAVSNFGRPTILMPAVMPSGPYVFHEAYIGTPWAHNDFMTKREHSLAGLHVILVRLSVLKLSEDEFYTFEKVCSKRLKRAKWAKRNYKKVQSPK
jgi:hypothetical protein